MATTQASARRSGARVGSTSADLPDLSGCSRRPSAGALVIVVFVCIVFAILSLARGSTAFLSASTGTLNYLDVAAQVGIVGTAVALLMIAGEFDLSIGSLVGFAGIVIGICVDDLRPADLGWRS